MRRLVFLVPGDPATATGGYAYDRAIVAGLRARGWTVDMPALPDGFPWPDEAARQAAARCVEAIPDGTAVVADGLAFGALPDLVARHGMRLCWIALVHHPLALETGLDAQRRDQLAASEARALGFARRVIVPSAATARALAALGVSAARLHVVTPGTDPVSAPAGPVPLPGRGASAAPSALPGPSQPAGLADAARAGPEADGGPVLLCVATLTPRKGHAVLLEALAGLQQRPWTLHCVGSAERDPATTQALHRQIVQLGLQHRVRLHGEVDAPTLQHWYRRADLLVLASYFEGYGMVAAEALTHGLPVIATTAGALPDTVPADAGLQVPPGDAPALRAALARLLDDPALRARLAAGARAAGARLPTWPQAVANFEAAIAPAAITPATTAPAGFSADWLGLREPFDRAARARAQAVADFAWAGADAGHPAQVVDLACGTGANLRALLPQLGAGQRWHLVDHDPALLAAVPPALAVWAAAPGRSMRIDGDAALAGSVHLDDGAGASATVVRQQLDLACALDQLPLPPRGLLTASALLDLVSAAWLQALLQRATDAGMRLHFSLIVDGRIEWAPYDPDDTAMQAAFEQHQARDKGFGPALGPRAAPFALQWLRAAGWQTLQARSDWLIDGAAAPALLDALIEGYATAAIEQAPQAIDRVQAWAARRRAGLAGSHLRVGHLDIAARPPGGD